MPNKLIKKKKLIKITTGDPVARNQARASIGSQRALTQAKIRGASPQEIKRLEGTFAGNLKATLVAQKTSPKAKIKKLR